MAGIRFPQLVLGGDSDTGTACYVHGADAGSGSTRLRVGSTELKSWLGHWLAERVRATNPSVNEGLEEVRSKRT